MFQSSVWSIKATERIYINYLNTFKTQMKFKSLLHIHAVQ